MALRHYDGTNPVTGSPYEHNVGSFNYDDENFTVAPNGYLLYIGNETEGEKITIPEGITDCTGMFQDTEIRTAPKIPNGVTTIDRMFMGCKNLQKYPEIPTGIESKKDFLSNISTNDFEYHDLTMDYITKEMDEQINDIDSMFQDEVLNIEKTFIIKGDLSKTEKEIINAELMSKLAICDVQIDGLTKMQNHLTFLAKRSEEAGAPHNYLDESIALKQDQIDKLREEMEDISAELKFRNPTAVDLVKAAAVDKKAHLISYSQKVQEAVTEKAVSLSLSLKKGLGNVYRAAELSVRKTDVKVLESIQKINKKTLEIVGRVYNRVVPGIYTVSEKTHAFKEAINALRANLKGEQYTAIPGTTQTGKNLINKMALTIDHKIAQYANNEDKLEIIRDKVKELSMNLSPKERTTSIDFLQNISQRMRQITASMRSAVQEKIATYQTIKEAKERGNLTQYEQEMKPLEIGERYPNGIRVAGETYPATPPMNLLERRLFYEVPENREPIYTQEEMNKRFDRTMANISNSSNEKIYESIKKVDEKGAFEKEDHAEVLSASAMFFGEEANFDEITPHKDNYMDTDIGQKAITESAELQIGIENPAIEEVSHAEIG